ncbi:transcription factor 24 [Lingula anatina]|uniref:Transcription factor 24 n=1 Tax=Lingula anatina TaxID=7574 RepID=A0A1S3IGR9_LINAN|nr:transcription factor 24 [Lingula anatina]|eukprot:XP_013396669.1 transcription factor 24 [Lingula anatina]
MKAERDHNGNFKTTGFISTENVPTRRRRGRPCGANAARERSRVQTLRGAFLDLQKTLPSVPPDTKLSKLDILVLATTYIAHLMKTLDTDNPGMDSTNKTCAETQIPLMKTYLHPVKKWPMRSRLYQGITTSTSDLANGNSDSSQKYCYTSNSSSDEDASFSPLGQQL